MRLGLCTKLLFALSVRHRLARCMVRHEVICKSALTQSTSLLPFLLVHHSSENSGLCTKAAVHCRSSKLPSLQVVQTAVHCRSSKLPYTAGRPNCCTLQVIQTAVHCTSSKLPYTAGRPYCRTLQVIQAADKLPRYRSLQRPQLTPEVVVWAWRQQMALLAGCFLTTVGWRGPPG